MDLKAAFSSNIFKKKAPKNAFYGSVSGSFSQKKKVVLGNVKYSSNERDIFLVKPGSDSMYLDLNSKSSCSKNNIIIEDINSKSLLGSAANTSKVKRVNTDPKIMKTSIEVAVRKLFALDINLLVVKNKSVIVKTQLVRKIFSFVNGFGGATILSKFEGIIRSTFTSEKRININSDLKKQGICSDRTVVIKKISMNMPKEMIIVTECLAAKWFFLIGKDSIRVAMAVGDHDMWTSRNWFRALLFTLPVGTTAHDLGTLLKRAGEKTCIINRFIETGNKICCTVIGFAFDNDLESAFCTELIFGKVKLSWARMNLICCEKCRCFGHLVLEYDTLDTIVLLSSKKSYKKVAPEKVCFQLAKLYKKKSVLISCSAAFGGKSWAQVVLLAKSFGGARFGSGFSFLPLGVSDLGDQISVIIKKLSFVKLVPLASKSSASPLVIPVPLDSGLNLNMVLDNMLAFLILPLLIVADKVANLSLSSSKVFDHQSFFGAGIAIIMNNSLACYVSIGEEVSGQLISVHLLFKNKLSVFILDFYASASISTHFGQAADVNSLISKVVKSSFFVVLGGNFNENGSKRSASFKFCLDLGLVNTFNKYALTKAPT
ncbi:hypothetical protein G9A89_003024 [Geosiphon pyriformis]|nr:hypothetical protein G9A89_003024 [Geosiphon pyriformis]